MQRNFLITMATMEYLLRMNTVSIVMKKGRLGIFQVFGAQHHDAQVELEIQTIVYMVRTFTLYTSLRCTDRGYGAIYLCSLSVKHLVWLYNRLPNKELGLTPL